ncbi:SCO family protein [Zobellella maritima]|uniref:SCO family protein n=1 Tax=Zobellella maritima TaxID=2059725 RepID=UPI000E305197|nr:SCO family protein [Zobellella maritima]
MKHSTLLPLAALLLAFSLHAALPGDSVYQLNSQWQTERGNNIKIADFAGKKRIIGMMYTDCLLACPMLVSNMQAVQKALSETQQQEVGFVLVSLTPNRDTPRVLRHFARKRGLDSHWTLLSGNDNNVRTLAMALNIQYQGQADGSVAHANAVTVLDEQGRLLFQQAGLPEGTEGFIERLLQER